MNNFVSRRHAKQTLKSDLPDAGYPTVAGLLVLAVMLGSLLVQAQPPVPAASDTNAPVPPPAFTAPAIPNFQVPTPSAAPPAIPAGTPPVSAPVAPPAAPDIRPAPANPMEPAEPEPYEPAMAPAEGKRDKLIKLNFKDTPLDQILEFYGDLTGRTMIKSPGINATITLRAQTPLSVMESLEALDSVLAMNNVVLVPMGEKFFKVVQPATARQEAMPILRTMREEPFPEADQLVSQVINLKHVEATEVQGIIQGIIHGYGKIQPLERTNSLLITDTANNIQRIMEILDFLDQPVEIKVETRIYELRYAKAGEIAGKLNELIAETQEGGGEEKPRVTPPGGAAAVPTLPGIIRPRLPGQLPIGVSESAASSAAELAERGIISGKVKIVADDRTNILFILSRPENFTFFDKIVNVLDRPVEAEFIVRVMALEYADAEIIAGILNEFIGAAAAETPQGAGGAAPTTPTEGGAPAAEAPRSQALRDFVVQRAQQRLREVAGEEASKIGQLSPQTRILADKRTNALMLMGQKADIMALQDIIDQLDIMLAQVMIEAVIMEVDLRDNLSQGVDWLQRAWTVYNQEKKGPGGGVAVNQPVMSFGGGQRVSGDTPFIDAATVDRDTPLGSTLTYYTTFYDLNLDAIIQLAAGSSDARILSTPIILTTDNTEAKILVGEERPIVTTSSTTDAGTIRSAYEYRNIGINLTVTPRINPERFVIMDISQQADDVGGTVLIDGNEVPIITKREFVASIAMDSRQTIVLGGLSRNDKRKSRSKVPLLGDIPILGALFRFDSREEVRTELMVFITPYVMMTPEEARAETRRIFENSNAPKSGWERGWSDSNLAVPPKPKVSKLDRPQHKKGFSESEKKTPMPRASVPIKDETDSSATKPRFSDWTPPEPVPLPQETPEEVMPPPEEAVPPSEEAVPPPEGAIPLDNFAPEESSSPLEYTPPSDANQPVPR